LFPHVAAYPTGRVYRAVPSDKDNNTAVWQPMARDQVRFDISIPSVKQQLPSPSGQPKFDRNNS
jgi:hypothetical protein